MPRIACPSCGARYDLPEGALGPAGKKVRCVRCGAVWLALAEPVPTAPPPWPEPPGPRVRDVAYGETAMPSPAGTPGPVTKAGAVLSEPVGLSARPPEIPPIDRPVPPAMAVQGQRGVGALVLAWGLSIAVLGAAAFGFVTYRDAVIEAWPASARLYTLLGLDG